MGFVFKFDFLSPEENRRLLELEGPRDERS